MTFQFFSDDGHFERVGFWFEVARIISVQRKNMAQKYFREMGNFLVNVPWSINQGDFRASRSWNLCFWSLKRFGFWLEAVASLDACQITDYQFLSKTHHFLLPDFWRIRERVFKSGILWPNAWAGVIKWFIRSFQKLCPSGNQGFLFKWFQGKNGC